MVCALTPCLFVVIPGWVVITNGIPIVPPLAVQPLGSYPLQFVTSPANLVTPICFPASAVAILSGPSYLLTLLLEFVFVGGNDFILALAQPSVADTSPEHVFLSAKFIDNGSKYWFGVKHWLRLTRPLHSCDVLCRLLFLFALQVCRILSCASGMYLAAFFLNFHNLDCFAFAAASIRSRLTDIYVAPSVWLWNSPCTLERSCVRTVYIRISNLDV